MTPTGAMSAGDLYGFAALFFTALAAVLMLLRAYLLKATKSLSAVRGIHVFVSTAAGVFLALHISALYLPPDSTGLVLGYATVIAAFAAWLTGTAFLTKVKDSLFYHGVLSASLLPLALMHVALSSTNLLFLWTQVLLAGAAGVALVNAGAHAMKAASAASR